VAYSEEIKVLICGGEKVLFTSTVQSIEGSFTVDSYDIILANEGILKT